MPAFREDLVGHTQLADFLIQFAGFVLVNKDKDINGLVKDYLGERKE